MTVSRLVIASSECDCKVIWNVAEHYRHMSLSAFDEGFEYGIRYPDDKEPVVWANPDEDVYPEDFDAYFAGNFIAQHIATCDKEGGVGAWNEQTPTVGHLLSLPKAQAIVEVAAYYGDDPATNFNPVDVAIQYVELIRGENQPSIPAKFETELRRRFNEAGPFASIQEEQETFFTIYVQLLDDPDWDYRND